jgi:hypothetical protein
MFTLLVSVPLFGPELGTAGMICVAFWAVIRLHFRVPTRILSLMIIPGCLLLLGLIGSAHHSLRDVLKDGWYFAFAPLAVLTGYLVARSCKELSSVLIAFLAAGAVLSLWQLGEFFGHRNLLSAGDIGGLRDEIGGGFILSLVAPLIVFLSGHYRVSILGLGTRFVRILIYAVTLSSVVFAFSRTMVVAMLIALVAGLGWITLKNMKGIIILLLMIAVLLGMSALVPADTSSLLGKFAQTRDEISFTDFSTTSDVTHYYRAYETLMALRTYAGGDMRQKSIGFGFGQLVDLGVEMKLGDSVMDRIPIFHNGYIYVLVKTGYLGLSLFFAYLIKLYALGARGFAQSGSESKMLGGLLMAMIGIVAVSTFVVSGWFNPALMGSVMLLIGILIAYQSMTPDLDEDDVHSAGLSENQGEG